MSAIVGRSVRLFLVEGKATGLITAEIMNWTGHVLTGPRSGLPQFLARPEVGRTGVYFLFGSDPENPDTQMLYIGESDHVGNRLKQHNLQDKKAYWERTCVVTSKDQNITKAHARYLEARLIAIAQVAGRAQLDNGTLPPPVGLPEADQSDMEFFIEQICLVLPVLGLDFLRESPKPSSEAGDATAKTAVKTSPVFKLTANNSGIQACAHAQEIDGEFVVFKGAQVAPKWKQVATSHQGYAKLHAKLVSAGKIALMPGESLAVLTEDVAFSSPSAASAVVKGQSDNGRKSWRIEGQNITYAAWQEQQVEDTAPTSPNAPD